jgi:hypothetical protein
VFKGIIFQFWQSYCRINMPAIELSCSWIVALLLVFAIFLIRAYYKDCEMTERRERDRMDCKTCAALGRLDTNTREGFHSAVSTTVRSEVDHGVLAKSHVRTLLTSTRDQIIRGAIMGAIGGGAAEALHNAVTWSLVGGIVTGCSDWLQWRK